MQKERFYKKKKYLWTLLSVKKGKHIALKWFRFYRFTDKSKAISFIKK